MGSTQSKIEEDEAVARCKQRIQFMEDAVHFRHAFASAYSAYAESLNRTGSAFNYYVSSVHPLAAAADAASSSSTDENHTPTRNLKQIFSELDDHFLKASESAQNFSKILKATWLPYHSNFADNEGHINHSDRIMQLITWNRSFSVLSSDDGEDDFDKEEYETHATMLDKMLALEKNLYDEVRASEIMKLEYQKKVASLNNKKKWGCNSESLEKLKASVTELHTRYIVDLQSMDSTVVEINRLCDEQLYPRLVQLVDGMAKMWETMRFQHKAQLKLVCALKSLEISPFPMETSEYLWDRTYVLRNVVSHWHMHFCKVIDHQKDYIKALNNWSKLNLIPTESNLKEKVSSLPRVQNSPIQALLAAWNDDLEKLPDEDARIAISNFAAVIETNGHLQEEELKMRENYEARKRELECKTKQFNVLKYKHSLMEKRAETDPVRAKENPYKEAVADGQFMIDTLTKQLEEAAAACEQLKEKSFTNLKTHLPVFFNAMFNISIACAEMYSHLTSISQQQQNPSQNSL